MVYFCVWINMALFIFLTIGNQAGDSKSACWNPQDFNLIMIQGCLLTGIAPEVDWDIEMTPVDYISDTIVTLTQKMGLSLGKVFNVMNIRTLKFR